MTQSRLGSLVEALVNVVIGYAVALVIQVIIFRCYGIGVSVGTNAVMGVWFTAASIIRSYALRRWFNRRLHNAIVKRFD